MKRIKLNFALIGCGRIAEKYAELFLAEKIKLSKIIAVCDIEKNRAKMFAERLNVPYYSNMDEMMKAEKDIDVVAILTPSGLHAEHTINLAKYRKHIIVEKPMALSISDAKKMIATADKHRIKLFVVKQNRFNWTIQETRNAFERKKLGKIFLASARVRWSRDQQYYNHDKWRGTYALDGGVFANQAVHYIDILQWFLGRPEKVFAYGQKSFARIEAEDTGVAILTYGDDVVATIEATVATRPRDIEGSFSLLGDHGTVEIAGFALNEIKIWNITNQKITAKKNRTQPANIYGFGHEKYLNHVVDAIINDKRPLIDGNEGLKTVEILVAIYESMVSGREIKLTKNFAPRKSKLGIINDKTC